MTQLCKLSTRQPLSRTPRAQRYTLGLHVVAPKRIFEGYYLWLPTTPMCELRVLSVPWFFLIFGKEVRYGDRIRQASPT